MHQTLQTQSILTKAQSYPSRSDAIPTVISSHYLSSFSVLRSGFLMANFFTIG